jgi:hypothetical protein
MSVFLFSWTSSGMITAMMTTDVFKYGTVLREAGRDDFETRYFEARPKQFGVSR